MPGSGIPNLVDGVRVKISGIQLGLSSAAIINPAGTAALNLL